MSSPFSEIDASSQAVMISKFGEDIRITPRLVGNYSVATDPGRATKTVKGIPSFLPGAADMKGQRAGGDLVGASRIQISEAEVWLDAAGVASLGYELRKGDLVELLDKPGSPTFSIARADDHGDGALTLILTLEAQPS